MERRFELTDEAKKTRSKKKTCAGRIVGESNDGRCWWIVFDNTKSPTCWHKDFIKVLETAETN